MTTSLLTRILQMATDEHQPPMIGGRRIKLKYAHPGGYNPPIIVVHGNQMDKLPDSYKRYLSNYYRKSLKNYWFTDSSAFPRRLKPICRTQK